MSASIGVGTAILLGIVQGLTEFLPVSSSGHLALAESLLHVQGGGVAFAVLLHAGTLLAIALVFRDGLVRLVRGSLGLPAALLRPVREWPGDVLFAARIACATVPGGVVGLLFEDRVEAAFASPVVVGLLLWVTALLLLASRRAGDPDGEVGWKEAWIIGLAQAAAILPGISRSGATIATALLLGVARPRAAEFSFLAAVPLILGSTVLEVPGLFARGADGGTLALVAGFATSFLVGWGALLWLVRLVRQGALHWFAGYCFLAGAAVLWLSRGA
jgi:undecaprenyl-diphosphatase